MNLRRIDDFPLWTGVVNITPKSGIDLIGDADGAYVGVAALAREEEAFHRLVNLFFDELGFDLVELDEVEQITQLSQLSDAEPSMIESIKALNADAPLTYGTFHCYTEIKGDGGN